MGGRLAEGTRPEKDKHKTGTNPTRAGEQERQKQASKQRNPVFSALRREGLFNKQKARDIPLLFSLGRFFEFLRFFPRAQILKECPQHFRAFLFQQPGDNLGFVVVRNVE